MGKKRVKSQESRVRTPQGVSGLGFELSPALGGAFGLQNTHLPRLHVNGRWFDLRVISLAEAEEIVAHGETFLYRIKNQESRARTEE